MRIRTDLSSHYSSPYLVNRKKTSKVSSIEKKSSKFDRNCRIFYVLALMTLFLGASLSYADSVDLVLVEKSKRIITLKQGDKTIRSFTVALGTEPIGPKRCKGDGKTPEGDYRVVSRNSASSYHLSLKISYPNNADIKSAQQLHCDPGGDIMIHGLPNGKGFVGAAHTLNDWTLGCIAVTDAQIEEIWKLVPVGTKVRILE